MLNTISDSEKSADARTPFAAGACLLSAAVRTSQQRNGSVAFVRPRPHASWAAAAFGPRLQAAGPGMAVGQRNPGKDYPTTTRIAAASGGAKGPHPEREPVPV
ncbi:MAG TPA: hypothetical protein VHY31_06275 [Streptosporangiaceae bacterium]|jgi:hypothetical protein|nr:hypothetical protein [Streptosporangiaceae bacterium]